MIRHDSPTLTQHPWRLVSNSPRIRSLVIGYMYHFFGLESSYVIYATGSVVADRVIIEY